MSFVSITDANARQKLNHNATKSKLLFTVDVPEAVFANNSFATMYKCWSFVVSHFPYQFPVCAYKYILFCSYLRTKSKGSMCVNFEVNICTVSILNNKKQGV